jgi:phospholipase A1
MYKIFYITNILTITIYASDLINYTQGLKYYQTEHYKKAYPIVLKEAKRGNKEAQYLLADMLEHGYGVETSIKKSFYWYKKAASTYQYIAQKEKIEKNDIDPDNAFIQKRLQFAFSKIDSSSPDVKREVNKMVNKNFGIYPYHTNYLAPISYASNRYNRHYTTSVQNNFTETYNSQMEVEFQLSVQKVLSHNLLGLNEYLTVAYTQQVWWQAYDDSAPFREINYTPEIFFTIPSPYDIDEKKNLKAIQFGFRHQSNGQEGYRSRSWNRLFIASLWQWDNIFLKAQAWYRIPEEKKDASFYDGTNPDASGDDNPNIENYLGYGDIEIKYLYGINQFGLKWRNNLKLDGNKGSIQLDFTRPFHNSQNTYWYLKFFNGYGESLIDYDRSVSKISFGFSFYRSLF